jgi:hypothetical protein
MRLVKWYADVVDRGKPAIFYAARLSLGHFHFGYRRAVWRAHSRVRTRLCLRPDAVALPEARDGMLVWPRPDDLEWVGYASHPQTLWASAEGTITWDPVVRNGAVRGGQFTASARGYAECLALDLPPWKLGLRRLYWGRHCGERHSLVWIEWRGAHPKRLALLDGRELRLDAVTPGAVTVESASLVLTNCRMLIDAPILYVAARLPRWTVRQGAPQFLGGRERKWVGEGRLHLAGGDVDVGAAIFEEVEW